MKLGDNILPDSLIEKVTDLTFAILLTKIENIETNFDIKPFEKLIQECEYRIRSLGGRKIIVKLTVNLITPTITSYFALRKYSLLASKFEYQAELSTLPDDNGTPFRWLQVSNSGRYTLNDIAKHLEKIGTAEFNFDKEAQNLKTLTSILSDNAYKKNSDVIHVGLIDEFVAAVVIAQVALSDSAAKVIFMGLNPDFRRKKLGKWVHRHGFVMLRLQGGLTYCASISAANKPMQALIQLHQCKQLGQTQEWALNL